MWGRQVQMTCSGKKVNKSRLEEPNGRVENSENYDRKTHLVIKSTLSQPTLLL